MNSIILEEVLQTIDKQYSVLSKECKIDISDVAKLVVLEKQQLLISEGELENNMYIIIKGCARAFYLKDGKDITDWFAFENDFLCSINSFFLSIPSPHFIETLEPSILLRISKSDTEKLSQNHHSFETLAKNVVIKTMLQLQERIVGIQFETAQQKYENLLKILPSITQRVALTHIASYLGITLETLSRIRNPRNTN
ncbi:Crp/Fnr family transcriptional regulator (plasmid) [Bernardetia sp. Wsw4-3y2]|uniref:Crp/Fnr family transcriptional regulator n=1 Tax=Bernardetia sp. Wsw4-3y2 TaxID=3127471 RepID=UPI0030CE2BF8